MLDQMIHSNVSTSGALLMCRYDVTCWTHVPSEDSVIATLHLKAGTLAIVIGSKSVRLKHGVVLIVTLLTHVGVIYEPKQYITDTHWKRVTVASQTSDAHA